MIKFNDTQLTTILAFYFFDGKKADDKKLKKFTDRFIEYYKVDISSQSISYEIMQFKNIDPSFSTISNNSDGIYKKLWKYYIDEDRVETLKHLYTDFKNNIIKSSNIVEVDDNSYNELIDLKFNSIPELIIADEPKEKYKTQQIKSTEEVRDLNVAFNALKRANFLCEYDNCHPLFIRKNIAINYTEGHHLVPLKFQDMFDVNLDVEANVVSLCSNCHNQIHYGRDYELILKKLYEERKNRLEKCGIHISFEELKKFYE